MQTLAFSSSAASDPPNTHGAFWGTPKDMLYFGAVETPSGSILALGGPGYFQLDSKSACAPAASHQSLLMGLQLDYDYSPEARYEARR